MDINRFAWFPKWTRNYISALKPKTNSADGVKWFIAKLFYFPFSTMAVGLNSTFHNTDELFDGKMVFKNRILLERISIGAILPIIFTIVHVTPLIWELWPQSVPCNIVHLWFQFPRVIIFALKNTDGRKQCIRYAVNELRQRFIGQDWVTGLCICNVLYFWKHLHLNEISAQSTLTANPKNNILFLFLCQNPIVFLLNSHTVDLNTWITQLFQFFK